MQFTFQSQMPSINMSIFVSPRFNDTKIKCVECILSIKIEFKWEKRPMFECARVHIQLQFINALQNNRFFIIILIGWNFFLLFLFRFFSLVCLSQSSRLMCVFNIPAHSTRYVFQNTEFKTKKIECIIIIQHNQPIGLKVAGSLC